MLIGETALGCQQDDWPSGAYLSPNELDHEVVRSCEAIKWKNQGALESN